jgi:hypothetical protein
VPPEPNLARNGRYRLLVQKQPDRTKCSIVCS